jgi:hypothetical protein
MSEFADVVLVLHDGVMQAAASGAEVSTGLRHNVEVPERP